MSKDKTEQQIFAENAHRRVAKADARSIEQKRLDLATCFMLQELANGNQLVIPAADHAKLVEAQAELEQRKEVEQEQDGLAGDPPED